MVHGAPHELPRMLHSEIIYLDCKHLFIIRTFTHNELISYHHEALILSLGYRTQGMNYLIGQNIMHAHRHAYMGKAMSIVYHQELCSWHEGTPRASIIKPINQLIGSKIPYLLVRYIMRSNN